MTIRKGDKIRCREAVSTHGLIHYKAPFTGGFECTIPAGTILLVDLDPLEGATGFCCLPLDYDAFELKHVPVRERRSKDYAGYSFVLHLADLGGVLEVIGSENREHGAREAVSGDSSETESGPHLPMKVVHRALAPLASLKVQKRFIIEGTKDNYLLPEDLLNTAINLLFEQHGITLAETETLRELKDAIRACKIPQSLSNHGLVLDHEPWIRVREKSRKYLLEIGFDLDAWERLEE